MKTKRTALLGILCALAVTLSFLEGLLPVMPIPGAKLGLSNIVTMFALSCLGLPSALAVTAVKALFALLRGGTAFFMSITGGLLSTLVMAFLWKVLRERLTFIGIGVCGAVAHNTGQLLAAVCLLGPALFYYAPWLVLMALIAGVITGLVLNMIMPLVMKHYK